MEDRLLKCHLLPLCSLAHRGWSRDVHRQLGDAACLAFVLRWDRDLLVFCARCWATNLRSMTQQPGQADRGSSLVQRKDNARYPGFGHKDHVDVRRAAYDHA